MGQFLSILLSSIHGSSVNSSYDYLTSWNSSHEERNCCDWEDVVCDNTIGRVMKLDLVCNTSDVWYLNASLFCPFQQLKYLDLNDYRISGWVPNECFERLSGSSKLEELHLDYNYINESFFSSLGQILLLKKLYLRYNLRSTNQYPNLRYVARCIKSTYSIWKKATIKKSCGFTLIFYELYLDGSYIDKSFLREIGVMTSLNVLTLQGCRLNGSLPIIQGLCELMNLRESDLSLNNFEGILPSCLANMTKLRIFGISSNCFNGSIDLSPLPTFKSLEYLDLSHNYFNPITFSSFFNLSKLEVIFSDGNKLVDETLSQRWNLGFQLKVFSCSSCLSIKSTRIITRFLYYRFDLQVLHLPHNNLAGQFPTWLLENNTRTVQLPYHYSPNLLVLDISFNNIQGPIPNNFGLVFPNLEILNISKNDFEAVIPSSYGNLIVKKSFEWPIISCRLQSLYLDNNCFSEEISHSISNSTILVAIDFSNNNLLGMLPRWMGNMMSLMNIAITKNQLEGPIPVELCNLKSLSFLKLSHNNLNGSIPFCFNPISNMEKVLQEVEFSTKNRILSYKGDILNYMSEIYLSCNKLEGEIPPKLRDLSSIHALNLSYNNLIGSIPTQFSKLNQIESLDLSNNNLDGIIPPQLIELNSLAVFNVARNNFWGTTPERKVQFGTFDESSYEGNPLLYEACGFMDLEIFYISFAVSYVTMLLGIVAILYINLHWRGAWFNFVEVCISNCYYFVVINIRKRCCSKM
ncbi:hypothetical protein I3760_15G098300 [Carya illinoinensis]|nr:hypothetical protein I3760_15G098300 [Carya illinoinensis]